VSQAAPIAAAGTPLEVEQGLRERCQAAVAAALAAGADQAEAYASQRDSREVALEKGDIQLARTQASAGLGLRVIVDGRLGFASTNQLVSGAFTALARDAVLLARQGPVDPNNRLPAGEVRPPRTELVDGLIWELPIERCVELARALLTRVQAFDRRLSIDSGAVEASSHSVAVASSAGVLASESDSGLSASVFGMAVDGADVGGFDQRGDWSRLADGFEARLERAVDLFGRTAVGNLGARAARSYRGPVLLRPEALVSMLLSPLIGGLSALAVQRGRSPLAGKLGQAVAGSNLTLHDDPSDQELAGAGSFDREGVPTERRTLVSAGRLETFLYNTYAAAVEGCRSTGHASGGTRSVPDIGLHALVMEPGSGGDEAALLERLGQGLLVGRFSGTVDPASGDFSGVAKSARWVEGGRVQHAAGETLLQGNAFEALSALLALSSRSERLSGSLRLPWALVDGVSVTAG
jgi:PmbA protein